MQTLMSLIEGHEEWLTDRVIRTATEQSFTEYSSTLREAWRISVCGLSTPLVQFIKAAETSQDPQNTAMKEATEFGISQGLKHRALGISLHSFVGLLKVYRNAYMDLVAEKGAALEQREALAAIILGMFDAIEIGLVTAWSMSSETERLEELQSRNRELSNEKNRYLTVFESISEPAILLDQNGAPLHVNRAAYRLLLGETHPGAGYYGSLESPLLHQFVTKLLRAKDTDSTIVALDTPGGVRQFDVAIQEMLDTSKKFAGRVIILQDVTAYLYAIDAAKASHEAKSAFLTTISHEIRTPINSILGLTRLLTDADLPEAKRKQLRGIRASGEILSALIENVLGLSKAETNTLVLLEQDFDLSDLTDALFQVLKLEELDQKLTLEKRIDPEVPLQLHGDGHKLRHVLLNLLSNALKYTKTGTVTLAVCVEHSDAADSMRLRFDVIDTGPGVQESELEGLFEPFHQGTNSDAVTVARGSGLGLAISKQLVEFLGGSLTYAPNPKGGSIFGFSLSFEHARQPKPLPHETAGHRVLVVEDDPVNAIVIEGYLKELGNAVTVAASYEAAVDALETQDFDILVTDYRLGGNTGLDVAKVAQTTRRYAGSGLPVIVVSAAIPQDASRWLQKSGASLFLEKPFSRDELANAMSAVRQAHGNGDRLFNAGENPAAVATEHITKSDLKQLRADLGRSRCEAVIRSYQSNMPTLVAEMRMRLEKGDVAGTSELAHQLISASGFVGATRLAHLASDLKDHCRAHALDAVQVTYAAVAHESEHAMRELAAYWAELDAAQMTD